MATTIREHIDAEWANREYLIEKYNNASPLLERILERKIDSSNLRLTYLCDDYEGETGDKTLRKQIFPDNYINEEEA